MSNHYLSSVLTAVKTIGANIKTQFRRIQMQRKVVMGNSIFISLIYLCENELLGVYFVALQCFKILLVLLEWVYPCTCHLLPSFYNLQQYLHFGIFLRWFYCPILYAISSWYKNHTNSIFT